MSDPKLREHVLAFDVKVSTAFSLEVANAAGTDEHISIDEANAIIEKFNGMSAKDLKKAAKDAKDFATSLVLFRSKVQTPQSCGSQLLGDGESSGQCDELGKKTDKLTSRAKYIANELAYCVWARERSIFGSGQPEVPFK